MEIIALVAEYVAIVLILAGVCGFNNLEKDGEQ